LLCGRVWDDRAGALTLSYGVAGSRATNVKTSITVQAELACGPKHYCPNGLFPDVAVLSHKSPRSAKATCSLRVLVSVR